jgi:MFS family permease
MLSLVASVFTQTNSNFGVTGVILLLSLPALFLMAFSGVTADLVDRRRILNLAFLLMLIVVFLIISNFHIVFTSIILSFFYFVGNTFFLPAVFAASGQVVKRSEIKVANAVFVPVLAGSQMLGLFLAAAVQFFSSVKALPYVSLVLLFFCLLLSTLLPKLSPRKRERVSLFEKVVDIWKFIGYVFSAKAVWFFFVTFASVQGIMSFGATIAPGFFDRIVGLSVNRGTLFIVPPASLGILSGAYLRHKIGVSEGYLTSIGFGILGISTMLLGILTAQNFSQNTILLIVFLYMVLGGFGLITMMIAARTVLQRRVEHSYQGTVFGANFVASSLFATIASPLAAFLVLFLGYSLVLTLAGLFFLLVFVVTTLMRAKWKF